MNATRLIVGLGNPGAEYRDTRHNAGFMLVDRLAEASGFQWRRERKFFAELAESRTDGRRWLLAKPQTYMNLSGECVGPLVRFLRLDLAALLVVADDADLPLGTIRLRPAGSAGGHHGLESVERHVGGREFARLKLGIARPAQAAREITGHVLGRFETGERPVWEAVLERAARQVDCWANEGIAKAMSSFNGAVNPPQDGLTNAERTTQ